MNKMGMNWFRHLLSLLSQRNAHRLERERERMDPGSTPGISTNGYGRILAVNAEAKKEWDFLSLTECLRVKEIQHEDDNH